MTAREYLSQAYRLDQHISTKLEQIDRLRALAQKVTASYDHEFVSHTRATHPMEDVIVNLMDAEEEIGKQVSDLIRLKMEIGSLIEQVPDENYRLVLEKRYLCFMPWEQIAQDMGYTRRWILSRHSHALEVVEKLLSEKEAA